jgi:3-oxoacyl-[acyl-carrier-protein] synthase III
MPRSTYLTAPAYVLGEIEADYTTIPDLTTRARELGLAPQPELWGWRSFRRTRRGTDQLAAATGRATLRRAALDPSAVDALVLCSTKFPGGAETHGRFVESVMSGLGLHSAAFIGVTLNRCTNLLAGIDVADSMIRSGRHNRVLVVTTDRIEDETTRMQPFALFSDGAASCLVAAEPGTADAYEVLCCASAQDTSSLDWSHEISSDLAKEVNDVIAKSTGVTIAEIDSLVHSNLFIPLVVAKERQAGFSPAQLDTRNVTRIGHCFAADPLVNLVDRAAAGQVQPGGHYLLAVSVPGSRLGVLARKTIHT